MNKPNLIIQMGKMLAIIQIKPQRMKKKNLTKNLPKKSRMQKKRVRKNQRRMKSKLSQMLTMKILISRKK
jgi:hypothetical protein